MNDPDACETAEDRVDRLYRLLPAIHRMRDAENGYALQALLRVIAEQVNVVEDDLQRLYDNWFIETAEDWVVPYIGDLVGYRPAGEASVGLEAGEGAHVLVPRREVANSIRYRRRKGSLALLEELARDVAGWPARAVEFFKLLGWTQNIDHLHLDRHRLANLRDVAALLEIDGPFDRLAHVVDVRRIGSRRTPGRCNVPTVGLFVWRTKSCPVTATPAWCAEDSGPHCYTFSVLGQDAPLFARPEPETDPAHIAERRHLPVRIGRRVFDRAKERWYGEDRSFVIWADGWGGLEAGRPVPVSAILPADLSGWSYAPPPQRVAVDPELGRIAFPPGDLPRRGVRVSYRYGFPADLGGGEYARPLSQPHGEHRLYRVGAGEEFARIGEALDKWREEAPGDAIVELAQSTVHVEPIAIRIAAGQSLQIRAANRTRPVIRLIDWHTDRPDAFSVQLEAGARLTLDGLLVTGRPVRLSGPEQPGAAASSCAGEVRIRHCTLVPGWGIGGDCKPRRPAEPSLEIDELPARVCIERSIVGSIQVRRDEVGRDPLEMTIEDSILDAAGEEREALGAPGWGVAHVALTISSSTVFGIVDVHSMPLGENCIFMDCVHVARRQIGCLRHSYVPPECRTPRRHRCQPDLVAEAARSDAANVSDPERAVADEQLRVRPQLDSRRYGRPDYARLSLSCADEIRRGADDGSEMGAYHHLYQPQREARLRARLEEFTPAGMSAGIVFVD